MFPRHVEAVQRHEPDLGTRSYSIRRERLVVRWSLSTVRAPFDKKYDGEMKKRTTKKKKVRTSKLTDNDLMAGSEASSLAPIQTSAFSTVDASRNPCANAPTPPQYTSATVVERIGTNKPEYGLGWSRFRYASLCDYFSCSLLDRPRLLALSTRRILQPRAVPNGTAHD